MPRKSKKEDPPVQKIYIYVNRGFDEKGCLMEIIEKAMLSVLLVIGFMMAVTILKKILEILSNFFKIFS